MKLGFDVGINLEFHGAKITLDGRGAIDKGCLPKYCQ